MDYLPIKLSRQRIEEMLSFKLVTMPKYQDNLEEVWQFPSMSYMKQVEEENSQRENQKE